MDGIGWFTWETVSRLAASHPDHHFYFLFDRPPDASFRFSSNVTPVVVRPITRLPVLLKFWHRISVPRALRKINPDIYLSPDFFLPPALPCPGIVIIHDLNFEHFPDFVPRAYRKMYPSWTQQAAKSSTRILTVSQFSKNDIINRYNIEAEKIDVVYCGVNSFIKPVSESAISEAKHRFGIEHDYFVVPGTVHPRKNTNRIISAYEIFRKRSSRPLDLVFAGNNKFQTVEVGQALKDNSFSKDIIFTGRVSEEDMNALIQGANVLLFVSLFEGFGLPILEAAKARVPVLTSANTSMQEIAGKTALLVDPYSTEEIAQGMLQISHDSDLRQNLISSGMTLPEKYSWDITAELIWESILKTVS